MALKGKAEVVIYGHNSNQLHQYQLTICSFMKKRSCKQIHMKKAHFFLLFDFLCLLYSLVTNQAIYIEEFSLNFPFPED